MLAPVRPQDSAETDSGGGFRRYPLRMALREDIRDIAIVAHVDHGKTTLVDAMLWQSGSFRANQDVADRVMDSMDLEREKGITILAKNTAVRRDGIKINIVDTPGHADFGGEVERALTMVDGVLLLVDASEGPLPQTRFVLAQGARVAAAGDPRRQQVDRPDARIEDVVNEVLRALPRSRRRREPDRVPDHLRQRASRARRSRSRRARGRPGAALRRPGREHSRAVYEEGRPAAGARHEPRCVSVSRTACACRIREGTIRKGQQVAWCRADGEIVRVKVTELYVTEALDRVEAEEAGPGELIAVAGIPRSRSARPLPIRTIRVRCP